MCYPDTVNPNGDNFLMKLYMLLQSLISNTYVAAIFDK